MGGGDEAGNGEGVRESGDGDGSRGGAGDGDGDGEGDGLEVSMVSGDLVDGPSDLLDSAMDQRGNGSGGPAHLCSDLLEGKTLPVTEDHGFPLELGKGLDGCCDPLEELDTHELAARCRRLRGQPVEHPARGAVDGFLQGALQAVVAVEPAVVPSCVGDGVGEDRAEPGEQLLSRVPTKLVPVPPGLEKGFLDHVGGIHPLSVGRLDLALGKQPEEAPVPENLRFAEAVDAFRR